MDDGSVARVSYVSSALSGQSAAEPLLENDLEIRFEMGCRKRGALRLSYLGAVASAAHSRILRYYANDCVLRAGDLVLVDCGAEFHGYCSDITRTFPVAGRFSAPQRALYDLVLSVSSHLLQNYCRPGASISQIEEKCETLLKNGLFELGVLPKKYAKNDAYFSEHKLLSSAIHFASHFIGIDCHDCNSVPIETLFEAGMTIALEPGLYLGDFEGIAEDFHNLSVRIEDNVLITESGYQLLSSALPRTAAEIEECMDVSADYCLQMQEFTRYDLVHNFPKAGRRLARACESRRSGSLWKSSVSNLDSSIVSVSTDFCAVECNQSMDDSIVILDDSSVSVKEPNTPLFGASLAAHSSAASTTVIMSKTDSSESSVLTLSSSFGSNSSKEMATDSRKRIPSFFRKSELTFTDSIGCAPIRSESETQLKAHSSAEMDMEVINLLSDSEDCVGIGGTDVSSGFLMQSDTISKRTLANCSESDGLSIGQPFIAQSTATLGLPPKKRLRTALRKHSVDTAVTGDASVGDCTDSVEPVFAPNS